MRRPLAKHCLECVTAAGQPAGYSSNWNVHNFGRFLVRESFDQYQANDLALLVRQPGHCALNRNDIRVLMTGWIRNAGSQLLRGKNPVAPLSRANLVNPRVAEDSEQPAGQRRIGAKLSRARQSPLDRNVHEVVGVVRAAGQRPGKASESRQQLDNPLAQIFYYWLHAVGGSMAKIASTLLIIAAQTAAAQVGVPNVRLPALPQPQLPAIDRTLTSAVGETDSTVLKDVRRLRLRDLVRRNRATLEVDRNGAPIVRGEVLVVSPSDTELDAALAAGFTVARIRVLDGLDARVVVLSAPKGLDTQRALLRLREVVPSATLDFNHIYTDSGVVPGRPESPAGLSEANAGSAEAQARQPDEKSGGSAGARSGAQAEPGVARSGGQAEPGVDSNDRVHLGLIDSGVDVGHAVFEGAPIHQHGCAGSPVPAAHGTAVASLMIGRSSRFHGSAPGAELYAVDVFCGLPTGGAADAVADAFGWLAREKVAVINVSLVGPPNATLEAVVRLVVARGYLIVAAVGNDGPAAAPLYPASYPGVVGVTGVDTRHRVLVEAGRGPQVKFAAPGADMSAAKTSQTFELVRGTSYAAPIVAGLLAVMLRGPDKDAAARAVDELARNAKDLGPVGMDPTYGYGLVGADLAPEPRLAGGPVR
jgi:hypothetical protein